GRRVGEVPYCRRCEFDLRGRPEGSERCPECGQELDAPRAIVGGEKYRRWKMATLGAVLLLSSGAALMPQTSRYVREYPWIELKPTGWVLHTAEMALPANQQPAFDELQRRIKAGGEDGV